MNFTDYQYVRPEIDQFTKDFKAKLVEFKEAVTFETQSAIFKSINELRDEFQSMYNICLIRHTINTKDNFYEEENKFFDENNPSYQALNSEFYQCILDSKFRKELEGKWGKQLFIIAELSLQTFKPTILSLLQEENKLSSEYTKIKASAEIEFEGKQYNLSALAPLEQSKDRDLRKRAKAAKWNYYKSKSAIFEETFDKLVKVRTEIAKKLGYDDFIKLGYARMLRSDYSAENVANFREAVRKYIVPLATQIHERQRKRLGLAELYYYDEDFRFESGNPKPQGEPKWVIEGARKMYSELSDETNQFFNFMIDKQLMDLVNKEGKASGGYCTYIAKFKSPYIFSNFNGTSGDIDVLTHEAGHAFQVFSSREMGINEYHWPTYEACEIHSMSMEFFTWPWMHLFFKQDTDKYHYAHLTGALTFLPYEVAVDEFQHVVYENPEMTPKERNSAWRNIEKKYLPHRKYGDNEFLENGGYWQRQNHIFASPFYYIDYALAQICAFQFWKKDQENHEAAWSDYLRLCKAGGSQSFLDLVELANLKSPFEEAVIEEVVGSIQDWIIGIDDSKF